MFVHGQTIQFSVSRVDTALFNWYLMGRRHSNINHISCKIFPGLLLSLICINFLILAVQFNDEDFLESDAIVPKILRGLGFEQKTKAKFFTIPILASQTSSKAHDSPDEQLPIHLKQSAYFVPGWADTRWKFRKNITIDYNKVSGTQTDFPVYIDLYDSDLQDDAQASGNDIFFTNASGHILDHEIEMYNRVYNSTHAHLVAWVKTDLSNSQDTIISMYYGNPTAGNQENPTAVWDKEYVGVWHLNEETGDSQDSTSYGSNGVISGGVTQNVVGQLGRGYDFDGTAGTTVDFDDPIDGHLDFGTGNLTVSFWYNVDQSTGDYQMPLYKGGSSNGISGYEFETSSAAETLTFYSGDGTQTYSCGWPEITFDTWHYIVGMDDRLANYIRIYQDSVNIGNTDISSLGNVDSSYHLVLSPNSYPFDGMIDEVRLSKSIRSDAWIQTEYNNQKDPTTFYSVNTKENSPITENWAQPAFNYRKNITIKANNVYGSGSLNDFPLLIDLYDTNLHDSGKVQNDGDDIAFTDFSGTKLDHELELFDQTFNSTHAHLIAWVRIPNLSGTLDTTISMYYGNTVSEAQQNPSGVWDSDYISVWHFSEEGSGTRYDSTSNNNDGTPVNYEGDEAVLGKIGGSDKLDGSDDYIEIGKSCSIKGLSQVTFEGWINIDILNGNDQNIFIESLQDSSSVRFIVHVTTSNELRFAGRAPDSDSVTLWGFINDFEQLLTTDTWFHVVAVFDSINDIHHLYLNGVDYSISESEPALDNVDPLKYPSLGALEGADSFNGTFDEFRISDIARSSDWIRTEYKNQNDTNSFYSVSSEERYSQWWADATFTSRKDIVIDKNKVGGSTEILTLRPEGVGTYTFLQVSGATDNWDAVNDVNYDTDTYVYRIQSGGFWGSDHYQTENAPTMNGATINSVTIKFRAIKFNGLGAQGRAQIYLNSQFYSGDEPNLGSSYVNVYSKEYQTSPDTGEPWTWVEVNSMEIGVGLKGAMVADEARATQVWAEVNYTSKEDLTNFPFLIDIIDDSDLKSGNIKSDAADLLFVSENGTKLDHEIEKFTQSGLDGDLLAWVRVPTLYASNDTIISMYYGNSELTNQENPEGVWNND
ncbi:MAG: DUF2341 domain-containing protein, partial [Candidatus Hodarchaeales archaeon]